MLTGVFVCAKLRAEIFRRRLLKLCPECITPLEHRKHKIFHSWVCPEGHGTLYPKGELERIVEAISGVEDLEVKIWNDQDRYSILNSNLKSPDSEEMLLEIRDRDFQNITVYGDKITHALWLHTGEEEKLTEHIEHMAHIDSVSAYLTVAAEEAIKIFDDEVPAGEAAAHTLTALALLGKRICMAFPQITL